MQLEKVISEREHMRKYIPIIAASLLSSCAPAEVKEPQMPVIEAGSYGFEIKELPELQRESIPEISLLEKNLYEVVKKMDPCLGVEIKTPSLEVKIYFDNFYRYCDGEKPVIQKALKKEFVITERTYLNQLVNVSITTNNSYEEVFIVALYHPWQFEFAGVRNKNEEEKMVREPFIKEPENEKLRDIEKLRHLYFRNLVNLSYLYLTAINMAANRVNGKPVVTPKKFEAAFFELTKF